MAHSGADIVMEAATIPFVLPNEEIRSPAEAAWFCVRTQPRREPLASRMLPYLNRVKVFFPRVFYSQRTRRGIRKKQEALFPGYLFAHFSPEGVQQVNYTMGVASVVRRGRGNERELAEVPAAVMEELFLLSPDGNMRLDDPQFKIGQKIRVIAGVFAGEEGEIVRLAPAKKRVAVLMEFLGQPHAIEIPLETIDVTNPDPRTTFFVKDTGNG
jgi:transcriptional antiterminator RfaH